MTIRTITAMSLVASCALANQAAALEAMRCNVQTEPGLFKPVLRLVQPGKIEDIQMGSDGLTRTMYYRDREVLDYVATKRDMPKAQMPDTVSKGCGIGRPDATFQGGQGDGGVVATTVAAPVSESEVTPDIPAVEPDAPTSEPGGPGIGSIFEGT